MHRTVFGLFIVPNKGFISWNCINDTNKVRKYSQGAVACRECATCLHCCLQMLWISGLNEVVECVVCCVDVSVFLSWAQRSFAPSSVTLLNKYLWYEACVSCILLYLWWSILFLNICPWLKCLCHGHKGTGDQSHPPSLTADTHWLLSPVATSSFNRPQQTAQKLGCDSFYVMFLHLVKYFLIKNSRHLVKLLTVVFLLCCYYHFLSFVPKYSQLVYFVSSIWDGA